MSEDDFVIRSTRDRSLVLSARLGRMLGTAEFDGLVNPERAVRSPLHRVAGTPETSLSEIFVPDCSARPDTARERLPDMLGAAGRPVDEPG
ncbi:hypothetical protein [Nocardia sp. X0981]